MEYRKPTIAKVGTAIGVIEHAATVKPDTTDPDSMVKPTDPAYRSDE